MKINKSSWMDKKYFPGKYYSMYMNEPVQIYIPKEDSVDAWYNGEFIKIDKNGKPVFKLNNGKIVTDCYYIPLKDLDCRQWDDGNMNG